MPRLRAPVYIYGYWDVSQFNLMFYTYADIGKFGINWGSPQKMKYIWGGQRYSNIIYDNWGISPNAYYEDPPGNDRIISLKFSEDGKSVVLTINNLQMANDPNVTAAKSRPNIKRDAPVLNFSKSFGIFINVNGNSAICGKVWDTPGLFESGGDWTYADADRGPWPLSFASNILSEGCKN